MSQMHWGYKPGNLLHTDWHTVYPIAKGQRQSPIDLDESKCLQKETKPLVLSYDKNDITYVENNGHSATFHASGQNSILTGGLLENDHRLLQFHFHWGSDDSKGGEHTLSGREFPAELHLVHLNTKYSSFEEALKHGDGLCVIGTFLEVVENESEQASGFTQIAEFLSKIKFKNQKHHFDGGFDVKSILPNDRDQFLSYDGSLTTPPLCESVQWIVMLQPVKISSKNLAAFRTLCTSEAEKGTDELSDNYRPPQPLNNRDIYRCVITK